MNKVYFLASLIFIFFNSTFYVQSQALKYRISNQISTHIINIASVNIDFESPETIFITSFADKSDNVSSDLYSLDGSGANLVKDKWPYKGYFQITPCGGQIANSHGMSIFAEGSAEFSLPRILSIEAAATTNYWMINYKSAKNSEWTNSEDIKKDFLFEYGINLHPIEWFDYGSYDHYSISYNTHTEEYTDTKIDLENRTTTTTTGVRTVNDVDLNQMGGDAHFMIGFRAGFIKNRFYYASSSGINSVDNPYLVLVYPQTYTNIVSNNTYLGLAYEKLQVNGIFKLKIYADFIIKNNVKSKLEPNFELASVDKNGWRCGIQRGSEFFVLNFEFGSLPAYINSPFYMKFGAGLYFPIPMPRGIN